MQRATFAPTPEEIALATTLGPRRYVDYHLDWTSIDDRPVKAMLAAPAYATLFLRPDQFVGQSTSNVANTLVRA